ncbi:hypothetical protein BKA81DRAFT_65631 [Phyllosticta paracitricarpa]
MRGAKASLSPEPPLKDTRKIEEDINWPAKPPSTPPLRLSPQPEPRPRSRTQPPCQSITRSSALPPLAPRPNHARYLYSDKRRPPRKRHIPHTPRRWYIGQNWKVMEKKRSAEDKDQRETVRCAGDPGTSKGAYAYNEGEREKRGVVYKTKIGTQAPGVQYKSIEAFAFIVAGTLSG